MAFHTIFNHRLKTGRGHLLSGSLSHTEVMWPLHSAPPFQSGKLGSKYFSFLVIFAFYGALSCINKTIVILFQLRSLGETRPRPSCRHYVKGNYPQLHTISNHVPSPHFLNLVISQKLQIGNKSHLMQLITNNYMFTEDHFSWDFRKHWFFIRSIQCEDNFCKNVF